MKESSVFKFIDRLFALSVCLPPVYVLFRFLRWYMKQENVSVDGHDLSENDD